MSSKKNITGTPEQIAEVFTRGISETLVSNIRTKLHEIADPLISEIAREYADKIAYSVRSALCMDDYGPVLKVMLNFNADGITYTTDGIEQSTVPPQSEK